MSNQAPENALFVWFGCLSNVGMLTGLAGLEVVRQLGPEKASIFCLGGLATEVPTVLDKTRASERIITVDGCPLNCARNVVAGGLYSRPDHQPGAGLRPLERPAAAVRRRGAAGGREGRPVGHSARRIAVYRASNGARFCGSWGWSLRLHIPRRAIRSRT